ncbi:hypothetical protein RND81_14G125500 [Saponaria officinalis]|uniref:Alpha/beta hydrolase fold-3 domain-containing protein n=1 Tax=Saponaria officinalis TaxID=3572 RepID=A0AAW1GLC0_SAPOF
MDYSNDNVIEWNYNEEDISEKYHFFNVLKDGRIHVFDPREAGSLKIPPSDDVATGVKIKDVMISDTVAARLFLPPQSAVAGKVPLLFYAHGGAFCMYSPFSVDYTRLLTNYVAEFNVVAVSVAYGLFPAHPGGCYDDSWVGLQWVASHGDPESEIFKLGKCEPWISDHADLSRVFIGGDSGGANISHAMMRNVRKQGLNENVKIEGMILVHPYFGDNDKQWMRMCPINEGPNDPRMKPALEDLAALSCDRVLVFLAEIDFLRDAGVKYVEELKKSGWNGVLEGLENKGKEHNFHITNYMDEEAILINQKIKSFIHYEKVNN